MTQQLLIGSGLIFVTVLGCAMIWRFLILLLVRLEPWTMRPPHGRKVFFVLSVTLCAMLLMMTLSVWVWAVALWALDIFHTFEASMYFSLVAFTTLGFGDVLLPQEWRLLSGLSAANGLLVFGLFTAALVETLRETRVHQKSGQS